MPANWSIPRSHPGETIFIAGGGPSRDLVDPAALRGRIVIAVNNQFTWAPFAPYLHAGDAGWWQRRGKEAVAFAIAGAVVTTVCHHVHTEHPLVRRLDRPSRDGLSNDPTAICGLFSGHQAINLAVHLGASRIVLIGFDGRAAADANGVRRTHADSWYETHYRPSTDACLATGSALIDDLPPLLAARGIEAFTTTPDGALPSWPYRPFEETIA